MVHERTSVKGNVVRHGSKHKTQVHKKTKTKQQPKQEQNRTHFQNKNNEKPEKRSLTKTKARGKNENRWVQQTHSLTHLHRHALATPPPPPPTHTHTHIHTRFGGKEDSTGIYSIKLEITTLLENKKLEKKNLLSLYVYLTSEFTHNKFRKVC